MDPEYLERLMKASLEEKQKKKAQSPDKKDKNRLTVVPEEEIKEQSKEVKLIISDV